MFEFSAMLLVMHLRQESFSFKKAKGFGVYLSIIQGLLTGLRKTIRRESRVSHQGPGYD